MCVTQSLCVLKRVGVGGGGCNGGGWVGCSVAVLSVSM